jgi:hypothetical protein
VYSSAYDFLFIHVPKTGGNSIQNALLPFSDDRLVLLSPHHDGVERFEIQSPDLDIRKHSSLEEYRAQLAPEAFERATKVTCVRNPWDRCVSFFFSPHRGPVTWSPEAFDAFIRSSVHPHAHYLALDGRPGDPFEAVDVILRFERLAEDFAGLCGRLGIGPATLPHVNASRRGEYRSYFVDEGTIDLVAEKFAPEIARFGYAF